MKVSEVALAMLNLVVVSGCGGTKFKTSAHTPIQTQSSSSTSSAEMDKAADAATASQTQGSESATSPDSKPAETQMQTQSIDPQATQAPAPLTVSGDSKASCAKTLGIDVSQLDVQVISNNQAATLSAQKGLYVLVEANRPQISLEIKPQTGSVTVPGVCVYIAGNATSFDLKISDAVLNVFSYESHGNKMTARVDVQKTGELKSSVIKLIGNQAVLSISGEGKLGCASLVKDAAGTNSSVSCGQ